MFLVVTVLFFLASPIFCEGRIGYHRRKVGPTQCPPREECCCLRKGICDRENTGAGIIEPRIMAGECPRGTEFCCPKEHDDYDYGSSNKHVNALNETCGLSRSHPSSKYKGDYGFADFGEYDFLVAILDRNGYLVGAGSLIDPYTVVTADHKVYNYSEHELKVRAREWNAINEREPLDYIERGVKEIIAHEYSDVRVHPKSTNLFNNVAVLKLNRPIHLDDKDYVGSICVPGPKADFTGRSCWVAGWGKDAHTRNGRFQVKLREVGLKVLPQRKCRRLLRKTRLGHNFKYDDDSFICAGGESRRDACTGDGGGPLMCKVRGRWFLAGMVAWGIGCGKKGVPGVYVNVPTFSKWIIRQAGRSGSNGKRW